MGGIGLRLLAMAALLGAGFLAMGVPSSHAASRICRQLEAELASAPRGGGNRTAVGKYDAAIISQRGEIAKARSAARASGCGFAIFGGSAAQCAKLNSSIESMGRNLDKLERTRARLAGGGGRDRSRILALLDRNGCREDDVTTASAPTVRESNRKLAKTALRQNDDADRETDDENPGGGRNVSIVINPQGPGRGEYRTMCVRTCDGYFFPMSNAASMGDFERDQKNCESSCPGTEMQVFYTRGMDADSAKMTSAKTGEPYAALPTAFFYKRTDVAQPVACGCNAARGFQEFGNGSANQSSPQEANQPDGSAPQAISSSVIAVGTPAVPKPAAEPEPETMPAQPVVEKPFEDGKVRVVGPTFLPDQAGAIDLQAPAPTPAR